MGYRSLVAAVGFLGLALLAGSASALPIEMTITATGSGTIGASSFTDASFTLHLDGDTADRRTVLDPDIDDIPLTSASIEIAGVGTAQFTIPTRVFVARGGPPSAAAAGFALESGNDILDIDNPAFDTWDMTTSIGPASNANLYPLFQAVDLPTTLGELDFSAYSNGTFTAAVMPEPASPVKVVLFAFALRRRRR
jgi:hypothetical protein